MGGYRRWLFLLGLVFLSSVLTGLPLPAAGQCQVRTDWPTVRVQRGDTLSRIARRYNTQVSLLMEANCLGSTRLVAGQTLHVPAAGVSPTAASGGRIPTSPGGTYSVGVTYRAFENGFMIWNSASGAIWVFNLSSGRVTEYPLAEYGGLALPRELATPQPGCFRPFSGFGLVWYNFPEVRSALGCATTRAEMSDQMMIDMLPFGRTFMLTFNTGGRPPVRVSLDGSWQYQYTSDPTPLPTLVDSPRIGTTYQAFDSGFMIWLATTSDIYVYIGSETGVLETYTSSQYAHLSVDTSRTIPANHFQPQNGFGRVWSHFVRDRIGWPVSGETGYLMTPVYDGEGTLRQFNLPDGNYARRLDTGWQVSGRTIPTPAPTATFFQPTPNLTITPYPTPLPQRVVSTWAAYQPFVGGFMFWRQDTDEVYVFVQISSNGGWVRIFDKAAYESWPNPTDTPPGSGFVTPINAFGKVWTQSEVRNNLGWATTPEQGYNATISDFMITGVKTIMYSLITTPLGQQVYANPLYSSWSWSN